MGKMVGLIFNMQGVCEESLLILWSIICKVYILYISLKKRQFKQFLCSIRQFSRPLSSRSMQVCNVVLLKTFLQSTVLLRRTSQAWKVKEDVCWRSVLLLSLLSVTLLACHHETLCMPRAPQQREQSRTRQIGILQKRTVIWTTSVRLHN